MQGTSRTKLRLKQIFNIDITDMTIAEIDDLLETIKEMQSTPTSNGNTSNSNNVRPADLSRNIANVGV